MPKKRLRKRVLKELTAEDKKRHATIRRQVERDKPRLKKTGREAKAAYDRRRAALSRAIAALKRTREESGLSLADVAQRSGIDKGNLSRLENAPDANPTIETLGRYADALGRSLVIELAEK